MTSAAAVAVRRVRVPAATPAARRGTVERWLADLDARRFGLPADALVAVRRLCVPVGVVAGGRVAHGLVAGGALRPALGGPVGAAADIVWFADEAELLACLARDALGGCVGERWWWPLLIDHTASPAGALCAWCDAPRAVPQALRRLGPDAALAWLAQAGDAGQQALLVALARAFPLPDAVVAIVLEPGHRETQAGSDDSADMPQAGISEGTDDRRAPTPGAAETTPPRRDAVTTVGGATPARLLRVCAALATSPQRLHDRDLCAELSRPLGAESAGPARPGSSARRTAAPALQGVFDDAAPSRLPPPPAPAQALSPVAAVSRSAEAAADGPAPQRSGAPAETVASLPTAASAQAAFAPAVAQLAWPRALAELPAAARLDTAFGGLLFVVNVATALGLYGDFTQPRYPGLALPPTQLLHAFGRAAAGRRFGSDPLAGWLRSCGFESVPHPLRWRVDIGRQPALRADARRWHALVDRHGLRLLHPAGICAAFDAGADARALPALVDELGIAAPVVVHVVRGAAQPPDLPGLAVPLLQARIAAALGMPRRPASALAITLPARVHASASRIDVHFALAALPIAVRLAGLDRDPGWLPAAGRDIRFHFG